MWDIGGYCGWFWREEWGRGSRRNVSFFSLIFSYFYLRSGIPSHYVAQKIQLRGTSPQSGHVVMDGWMG